MTTSKSVPDIKSVLNFRDAGGLSTSDDKRIREKVIFRSASPDTISKKDIHKLHELDIRTIVDLRAPYEGGKKRRSLEGFDTISLPLDFERTTRERLIPLLKHKDATALIPEMIVSLYQEILDGSLNVFRSILELLLDPLRTPLLIHCHAGKDRTGIICALIQMALNADRNSIEENYMESNSSVLPYYRKSLRLRKILYLGFFPSDLILYAITVRENNILSVIDRIETHYDGIEGYLKFTGPVSTEFTKLRERFII